MTENFIPELGQMFFGQPWKRFTVPPIMEAVLSAISDELSRVMSNIDQQDYDTPFSNTGASFSCPTFTAVAYSWSDEEQPYNFKHHKSGLEISWYKWFGRGASANMDISPNFSSEILEDCLAAILRIENGEEEYTDSELYPDGELSLKGEEKA